MFRRHVTVEVKIAFSCSANTKKNLKAAFQMIKKYKTDSSRDIKITAFTLSS